MRLLNLGLFASILFFGISCSNSQKVEAKASDATMNDSKKSELHPIIESVDFYAKNEEQGWKLSIIYDEQIVFTDTKNEISYVSKNLVKNVAQGANVIQISSQNETHLLNVNIDIVDCMKSGKKINIMLRKIDAKKGNDYSGCGFYRGTPQLHDIWALHSINGKEIKAEQFPKELPHFEFNLTTQKMSGFAGCNQVNGNLHFSYNRIKISELVSTRMYCGDASDIENQILGLLRSEPFYRIDGLYLTLETTKGIIKLKKVD